MDVLPVTTSPILTPQDHLICPQFQKILVEVPCWRRQPWIRTQKLTCRWFLVTWMELDDSNTANSVVNCDPNIPLSSVMPVQFSITAVSTESCCFKLGCTTCTLLEQYRLCHLVTVLCALSLFLTVCKKLIFTNSSAQV